MPARFKQLYERTYPDITPFQEAVAPMHQEMLENYPDLAPIYELIQAHNAEYPADSQ